MQRKKREQRQKGRKWKYADFAKKRRHCERCTKLLSKDEPSMCRTCYDEIIRGYEVKL